MSKELQALERIENNITYLLSDCSDYDELVECFTSVEEHKSCEIIRNALQRLEQIDNAKPSEALKDLKELNKMGFCRSIDTYVPEIDRDISETQYLENTTEFYIIKQALIKAQEQEKENAYIEKIKTMMKQKDCVLRYIESEDCFAVKTILSDGWYKLTPDFVENNVREEIKPLPLIEKNKQLKEENAELKKVLEIIKEKNLFESTHKYIFDYTKVYATYSHMFRAYKLDEANKLTAEGFDLLKRWLG